MAPHRASEPHSASLARPQHSPRFGAVAFDFDGTLADTTTAILATVVDTLAALQLPPIAPERLFALIGLPLAQAFAGLGVAPEHVSSCVVRYREIFPRHAGGITLFPAVRACLTTLAEGRMPMAIVSSRGRRSLLELIEQLSVGEYFAAVLGAEDALNHKPAPDLVLSAAAQLGVAPENILVVGDTTYDILMGRAAGAVTCAVTYGNHDWQRLQSAEPHHRLDSLSELWALLAEDRPS